MDEAPVRSPTVYVIAGPNGAGKTKFATSFLPDFANCREFVNADLIAAGLSPFAPETQAMRAGRLLLIRIKELAEARQDFGFETTLARRSYVRLISEWKRSGYNVVLFFLWLPTADAAVARVRQGGHDVPEVTIRRSNEAGIRNFFTMYAPLMTWWYVLDGAHSPPSLIASQSESGLESHQPALYRMIQRDWGD